MSNLAHSEYKRCFISAPFGLELGVLPKLLTERNISWEWAKDEPLERKGARSTIASVDFVLIVLNGTKADYGGAFDAGIAVGLRKPIFLIKTKARTLPLDYSHFTVVKAALSNRDALSFHLDFFLAAPPVPPISKDIKRSTQGVHSHKPNTRNPREVFDSLLEKRVYEAVIAAGGSAIPQPRLDLEKGLKFRPDLLAWLGNVDGEFLDPVVIEVTGSANLSFSRQLDEKLLDFLQLARIKIALVLTVFPPPEREQQLSPNVIWLMVEDFERLIQSRQLGIYVRETRNRIAHGLR